MLGGINQPLPLHPRFHVLAAKSGRARAGGQGRSAAGCSAAIEKEDNEALSVLRASHQRAVLGMTEAVKYAQWQEATKAREGVEQSLATAWHRYTFYARQLGAADADLKLPDVTALDSAGLASGKFRNDKPALVLTEGEARHRLGPERIRGQAGEQLRARGTLQVLQNPAATFPGEPHR